MLGLLWLPVDNAKKKWGSCSSLTVAPAELVMGLRKKPLFPSPLPQIWCTPCEITSVVCPLCSPDLTGEVASREIAAQGLLFSATVKYRTVGGGRYSWNLFVLDFMEGPIILGHSHADYDWTLDGAAVRCFLVGVHSEQGNCYLLVLKDAAEKSRNKKNVFERIGLVEVFGHKVRKVLSNGTVRMVFPHEVVKERSDEETITLV